MAAILGIVASFLGPAIELGKCVVVPIQRQFDYLCCFNSNIQNLREEEKKLEDARDGLKMRVNVAENNAEVIVPEVETWLEDAGEIQVKMSGFETEITNIQGGGGLAVKSRFSLSKKIKKAAEAMKKLRERCNFNPISLPAPPASMVLAPLGNTYEFKSRKNIEESIMNTLRVKSDNVVGICGMGGVGKTTMAKQIMDRVNKENMFDEAMIVVVSQQVDMFKIQDDIAKKLGLTLEEGSLSFRAHRLRTRLMCGKRILIVLDDLWKKLKLEDLGIPCESDSKCCTVILTSRNKSVFSAMNVKFFTLDVLCKTEAWYLFKSNVGTCVDNQDVLSIAQEVVKECKGLPIALVTVGVALKDEKNTSCWKDALQQLKDSNPVDMPELLNEVYKPLRLSFDLLESEHAKSLFLLCCLFPEDEFIPLENLTHYAMGLRMFGERKNLEQTRNKTYSLIEMLKSRFLLLDGFTEDHARMHDVIRDVAIFISSKDKHINCNDSTWISFPLQEGTQHSMGLNANIRLLLIDNSEGRELEINDNFFEGVSELNVLSITNKSLRSLLLPRTTRLLSNNSLRSLPHTIRLLKNLRTLILYRCTSLESISIVGELVSLEILICCGCERILELPVEIKRLKLLKLLDITDCRGLKRIVPGVISSLIQLEELLTLRSYVQWEADVEGKERKNASLTELQSLSHLTCFKTYIDDSTLVAEEMHLSPNIVNYDIRIGRLCWGADPFLSYKKKMEIALEKDITPGNWINKLLRSVEVLCLEGDGSSNVLPSQYNQNVKLLYLVKWSTLKTMADVTTLVDNWGSGIDVFPLLEVLFLVSLDNLEEIWGELIPIGSNSFRNLEALDIEDLASLKHLWKSGSPYQNNVVQFFCNLSKISIKSCQCLQCLFVLSMAEKDCLFQLESLQIWDCEVMEHVLLWNEAEEEEEKENEKNIVQESHHLTIFSKLKSLVFVNLPNLTAFCKGIEGIEFPLLTNLEIQDCPNLKGVVPATRRDQP